MQQRPLAVCWVLQGARWGQQQGGPERCGKRRIGKRAFLPFPGKNPFPTQLGLGLDSEVGRGSPSGHSQRRLQAPSPMWGLSPHLTSPELLGSKGLCSPREGAKLCPGPSVAKLPLCARIPCLPRKSGVPSRGGRCIQH